MPEAVYVSETLHFFRKRECEAKKGRVLLVISTFSRGERQGLVNGEENNFLHETEGDTHHNFKGLKIVF